MAIPKSTTEVAIKSLKDNIDGIKSTVDKIVTDREKKYEGLKKLEVKINGIEKILGETIPTLKFAKDCIKEWGGRAVIMDNLMMAMAEKMTKVEDALVKGQA